MKLGTQVGLGPGHIVLDGDPTPPPQKGHSAQFSAHMLRPNGCMAWINMSLGIEPRRLCVTWGPRSPSPKGQWSSPQFSAHVYCGQTAGWMKLVLGMEVYPQPRRLW